MQSLQRQRLEWISWYERLVTLICISLLPQSYITYKSFSGPVHPTLYQLFWFLTAFEINFFVAIIFCLVAVITIDRVDN